MCEDCGCQQAGADFFPESDAQTLHIAKDILSKNNHIAHHNEHWFQKHDMTSLNIMSSPGSGKTELLEKTIKDLRHKYRFMTLVGDQQTDYDAIRIRQAGAKVQQISTHSSCHLNAGMVARELDRFVDPATEILFIENVGNLVCPPSFHLGESEKIALLSTPEGEDKPRKYPVLFHQASLVLITKIDLLPHLEWDEDLCLTHLRAINPGVRIIKVSAKTGEGLEEWYQFLREKRGKNVPGSTRDGDGTTSRGNGLNTNGRSGKRSFAGPGS